MKQEDLEQLQDLKIDDFIWYIFIFIAVASLISNSFEEEYVKTKDLKEYNAFHHINEVVFIVALIIYLYFLNRNYKIYQKKRDSRTLLNLIAAVLVVISGSILLVLELSNSPGEEAPELIV